MRGGGLRSEPPLHDHEVAVADPRVERDRVLHSGLEIRKEPFAFRARDMARREICHDAVTDGDQVAPVGEFGLSKGKAHACRFERSPAGIIAARIIAQDREIGDIAPGLEACRDRAHHPAHAVPGYPVHVRRIGVFERCLSSKFRYGLVGHSVAQDNDVLPVRAHASSLWPEPRSMPSSRIRARAAFLTDSRDPMPGCHPRLLSLSTESCILGTSPTQPRSPPV